MQLEDAPAALAAPPAVPTGLLKGTSRAKPIGEPGAGGPAGSTRRGSVSGGTSPSKRRREEAQSMALSLSLDPEMAAFDRKD